MVAGMLILKYRKYRLSYWTGQRSDFYITIVKVWNRTKCSWLLLSYTFQNL